MAKSYTKLKTSGLIQEELIYRDGNVLIQIEFMRGNRKIKKYYKARKSATGRVLNLDVLGGFGEYLRLKDYLKPKLII